MSDPQQLAYLPVEPDYSAIVPGMEIITDDALILGRIISVEFSSRRGSPNIFFVDTIHPVLKLLASTYQMSGLEVATIGHNRIILAKDAIERIVEVKVGVFRSIGLVDSLTTKIGKKRALYHRLTSHSKNLIDRGNRRADDVWVEDGKTIWSDRDDENPPSARVPRPKKTHPNLPPLMRLVDEEEHVRV